MDVFDLFESTSYTFQILSKGGVKGNSMVTEFNTTGILKTRDGVNAGDNIQTVQSDATLHIRPDEAFIAQVGGNMVGHGIKASNDGGATVQTYSIIGQKTGRNFESGENEFYLVTLKREKLAA